MKYKRRHINPKIKSLRRKQRLYQKRNFWIFLLFLIIVITLFYILLFFPKFQVAKVIILDNKKVQREDIENLVLRNIDRKILNIAGVNISTKSIFFVNSKKIIEDILNNFSNVHEVKVEKKLPNNIVLKIKERDPFAIFCKDKETCFLVDYNGVIFNDSSDFLNGIVLKKEVESSEIKLGDIVVEKNIVNMISKIKNQLKDNFQIDIKEVFVSNFLIFETSLGWKIYFNAELDIDLQITKMNILLKDEITVDQRKNLQYIYLQYKDRAYYK